MKAEISQNLKSLQTLLKKNEEEKTLLKSQLSEINKSIISKDKNINEIKEKIKKLKNKEVIISEHAILRYLERVEGIDIEGIKNTILTDDFKKQYSVLGDGKFPIDNKFFVRVKDNVIVTILPIETV